MNLCRPAILTDVHPEARNAWNIGALSISLEAEHVCVKTAGLLQFFRFGSDADAVMVKFNDFDWHKTNPIDYSSIAPPGRTVGLVDTRSPLAYGSAQRKVQMNNFRLEGQTMVAKSFSCDEQIIRRFLIYLFLALLAVCSVIPALDAQGVGAAIQGTVRDTSGAIIPGAMITAINTETNLRRTGTSNESGLFSIPNLPPGKYWVQGSLSGFLTRVLKIFELVVRKIV